MNYNFEIARVYMYCSKLTITDGINTYEAVIEDAPEKNNTLLIWLDDFGIPENKIERVKTELVRWCEESGYKCIFNDGSRC